jgi:hypothetical protein
LVSPDLELRVRTLAGYKRSGQIVTKANLELDWGSGLINPSVGGSSPSRPTIETAGQTRIFPPVAGTPMRDENVGVAHRRRASLVP